ncbi:hypothetical protein JCM8097_005610 [Rhodosporidiobolus ruineniae]
MTEQRAPLTATINCDCGESFGSYSIGDDAGLFPIVDIANLACGFHGGDFDVMDQTVALAKTHGVGIGAHPGLPDLQGFGRRQLFMPPESFFNCLLYQVGALEAFLKLHGLKQNHLKPHGQAYVMSSKDIDLARQSAKVAKLYGLPLLGLPGSAHQTACDEVGVEFIPEWYADLQYGNEGQLLAPRSAALRTPLTGEQVYKRTREMLETSSWLSSDGSTTIRFPEGVRKVSICVHGDFPGAVEVAKAVRRAIEDVKSGAPAAQ